MSENDETARSTVVAAFRFTARDPRPPALPEVDDLVERVRLAVEAEIGDPVDIAAYAVSDGRNMVSRNGTVIVADLARDHARRDRDNQGEPMTTPTLTEATKRLAGAVPAKPEWAGSVSVDSRDLEIVTEAVSGYVTAVEAQADSE